MALTPTNGQALLDAQLDLWGSTFAYIKSMALKSALDLCIADAIENHGGAATLHQIATNAAVHPAKIPCLRRLMRVLTATGVFTTVDHQLPSSTADGAELVYALTPTSRLLVGPGSLVPITAMTLHPALVSSFFELGAWLRRELPDPCIFKLRTARLSGRWPTTTSPSTHSSTTGWPRTAGSSWTSLSRSVARSSRG
ncbi:unnamed protein product [Urochloa humidicola]